MNLTDGSLESFSEHVSASQADSIKIVGNRDDLHEIDEECWKTACQAIDKCPLVNLEYTTTFCRPGYVDKRVSDLLQEATLSELKHLTIHDGLYGYAETFLQIQKLQSVETIVLKDMTYSKAIVDRPVCEALALTIRSLSNLQSFTLWSACFANSQDWEIILDALRDCKSLENVDLFSLCIIDSSNAHKVNVSKEAMKDPALQEMRNRTQFLRDTYGPSPYTTAQRLDAALFVRGNSRITNVYHQVCSIQWIDALSCINDDAELVYEALRCQADPSVWAN
jgi:hypothetical protein